MMRLLCLLACSCSLVTRFDRAKAVEQTAALCSDGIDNDGDGLTDCQDWKCLDQPTCCTIPVIVLSDDFEHDVCSKLACGSGACPASSDRWQEWGSPLPEVCEGAFVSGKVEQCYDVGLLSVAAVPLRPGLVVTGGFAGTPEVEGRMRMGVTFQTEVIGSLDPCAPIEPAELAIGIAMESTTGGYRFVAQYGQQDIAASATLTDGARHALMLRITDDRRVTYELDGTAFATSSPSQTVPAIDQMVHVVLMGRGSSARIDDLEVTLGARCEDPTAWLPAPQFLDFGVSATLGAWDSFAVYSPSVSEDDPGTLYYGGCTESFGACDPVVAGYGRATTDANGQFTRDASCPLISSPGLVCTGGIDSPFSDLYNNVFDLDVAGGFGVLSQRGGAKVALVTAQGGSLAIDSHEIDVGPAGSWDAAEVCCAAIVVADDGTRLIWFSGRAVAGGPQQIGLARWTDSGVIEDANNPMLVVGPSGGIDDHGVHDPDVIWDADRKLYRMWYVADGPLGLTSIAYAVSTDGVRWHEAPQNPVVSSEQIGLRRVGAPSVISQGGELEMWIEGVSPSSPGSQIYRLVNTGVEP
jgi:hypothetical protein